MTNSITMTTFMLVVIVFIVAILVGIIINLLRKRQFESNLSKNINEVIQDAINLPTLHDAIVYVCIWENNRAVYQAINNKNRQWETCFSFLINKTTEAYLSKTKTIATLEN